MFGFINIAFMNFVILYRVCVTNEHWYVWFVLIPGHSLVFAHALSPCVIHDRFLAPAAWWIAIEHGLIYDLESLCPIPPLMGFCCSNLRLLMWTIVCRLFVLLLTFVLRYVGSGSTNVVFWLSLYLLGLKLSLYLVCILYFVVKWVLIRLHQSKKAHSTTWQALLICKYQIISIFPCCNLQNMEYV